MQKRNIYLVQTDVVRVRVRFKSAYLPFAAGQLWAYARTDERVAANYDLKKMVFANESIQALVDEMDNPFLVGFSALIWNTEYSKTLAIAIKERYPDCLILFGGSNVPPDNSFLQDFPFIDYLVHGEGEIPFQRLLLELLEHTPDLSQVPGIHYRDGNGDYVRNPEQALTDLTLLPSPYLSGVYDDIMAMYPDIQWSCCFESMRGCPYHCTYCSWSGINSKLRLYPMERIRAEIEWFGRNKIEYIMIVDSNFGILERDSDIADLFAQQREQTGYPFLCSLTYAKHSSKRVFDLVVKFTNAGLNQSGATVSMQSLNPVVQKNIGRENLPPSYYEDLIHMYTKAKYSVYTELILGLPGETPESFREGIGKLLDMGQHDGLIVYQCIYLPRATLSDSLYRERHKIEATRFVLQMGSKAVVYPAVEDITEYYDIVTATETMSAEEMTMAYLFSIVVQGCHTYALTRWVAMYVRTELGIKYEDLYYRLLRYAMSHPETLFGRQMRLIESYREGNMEGKQPFALRIPYESGSTVVECSYLFGVLSYELERFFDEILPFFLTVIPDETLCRDLLRYQKECIRQPNAPSKVCSFAYDFPSYFAKINVGEEAALEENQVTLSFTDSANPTDWPTYGFEVAFRGVRNNRSLYEIKSCNNNDKAER